MATGENGTRSNTSRPTGKSILFIEARLNDDAKNDPLVRINTIRQDISQWVRNNFKHLKVAQHLDTTSLPHRQFVQCLQIADWSKSKVYPDDTFHSLAEIDLDIAVYSLFDSEDDEFPDGKEKSEHLNVTQLPHKNLHGLWESLIFAEPIRESSLRIITRMLEIAKEPFLSPAVIYWHNIVLLYGPPGSGKTTLAQALAQKLSIRLSQTYAATKMVEVNSHTLLSKWFGESSKLVGKLFETILSISSDESLLTVVLIDEVETLASSREKATQGNECGDAIRSTNELLQGLDRLRKRSNVIFLCTSNLIENIDSAFVDRCGIKQCVGTPSVNCAYEIFRSVINELIKANLVFYDRKALEREPASRYRQILSFNPPKATNGHAHAHAIKTEGQDQDSGNLVLIPELEWVNLNLFNRPTTAPRQLKSIAESAEGLSGRTLRRLPMLAITKYTVDKPCDLQDLLDALKRVLKEEDHGRHMYVFSTGKPKDSSSEDDLIATDQLNEMSIDDLVGI